VRPHTGFNDGAPDISGFSENIDKHGEGLTTFLAAAIRANAGK
jgi:hypothetical protein